MSSDPYEALGVPRDASADAIRQAYRALALRHHPDRGGDPAAFQAATEAAEVLTDPDRRARYDATGDRGGRRAPDPNAELMAVLVPCMAEALQELVNQGNKPDGANLVAFMKRVLETKRAGLKKRLTEIEKVRAAVAQCATRFKEPRDAEALLAAAARHHLHTIDEQTRAVAAEEARLGRALGYLARCDYEFTPHVFGFTATATTSAFWRI